MKFFNKIKIFLKEVLVEVKKVNWPTKKQTLQSTLIVLGISVAVAAYLGAFDYVFQNILSCISSSAFGGTCFGINPVQ
jgi:preprotein translocase subunit SecE